jgi:hypothetical protein
MCQSEHVEDLQIDQCLEQINIAGLRLYRYAKLIGTKKSCQQTNRILNFIK